MGSVACSHGERDFIPVQGDRGGFAWLQHKVCCLQTYFNAIPMVQAAIWKPKLEHFLERALVEITFSNLDSNIVL
jgi:hypothetical protein